MKTKRRLTWCLCCLIGLVTTQAQTVGTTLVLQFIGGGKQTFILQEKPVVTFVDDNMKVVSATMEVCFPRADIKDFHFEGMTNGISPVVEQGEQRIIALNDNQVVLQGLNEADRAVCVYDINGRVCQTETQVNKDSVIVFLTTLKRGVYIIRIGNRQSIKITKK